MLKIFDQSLWQLFQKEEQDEMLEEISEMTDQLLTF